MAVDASSCSFCFGPRERNLSRSVPPPRARDWSPPPPTEQSTSPVTASFGAGEQRLHKVVWLADAAQITELLDAGADIDEANERGATPLMLAVELLPRAPREYLSVVRLLLDRGANPRLRSSVGWSPLDEAVSRGDAQLVQLLFEGTQRSLEQRWAKRLDSVAMSLSMLPDFECSIRWEFESPVLPLVHKIAPSDVVRLRKRGTSLRVDSTLASWKRFRLSKRRELTTLFRSGAGGGANDATARGGNGNSRPSFLMINHSKQTVVDVTEGLDGEEVSAVVEDLIAAQAVQWDMKLSEFEVAEATTWLGTPSGPSDFNGWRTSRFDVRGNLGMAVRKKGDLGNIKSFQEYFGSPLPADACLPELRAEFDGGGSSLSRQPSKASGWSEASECVGTFGHLQPMGAGAGDGDMAIMDAETMSTASEVLTAWPDSRPGNSSQQDCRDFVASPASGRAWRSSSLGSAPEPQSPASGGARPSRSRKNDSTGKTSKSVSASVWLATDFAIPLDQFLPILEALSVEHAAMRQLQELLRSESLASACKRAKRSAEEAVRRAGGDPAGGTGHVFPVRASVPLNMVVRAHVHFESFKILPADSLPADLFDVPQGYKSVPRREAQKTPNRAKKRMLLANITL